MLVDLANKELLKLMRGPMSFDAAGNLMHSNVAPTIQILPHLPPLLDLALLYQIRGYEQPQAVAANTMASNVGEETTWPGSPPAGCGAMLPNPNLKILNPILCASGVTAPQKSWKLH